MKKSQKGFILPLAIIIIALLVIGSGVYIYKNNGGKLEIESPENTSINTSTSTSSNNSTTNTGVIFGITISGNILTVVQNDKVTQTLIADNFALHVIPSHPPAAFITEKDVNFDGHNDIAVLTSTGYAGVNYYYDYYIYNSKTKRFEKDPILTQFSNPEFDLTNKKINSSYRSGPQWYSETFQWNGLIYIRSAAVPTTSSSIHGVKYFFEKTKYPLPGESLTGSDYKEHASIRGRLVGTKMQINCFTDPCPQPDPPEYFYSLEDLDDKNYKINLRENNNIELKNLKIGSVYVMTGSLEPAFYEKQEIDFMLTPQKIN